MIPRGGVDVSTALHSAAWASPAYDTDLMHSTQAHGAGITAISGIGQVPSTSGVGFRSCHFTSAEEFERRACEEESHCRDVLALKIRLLMIELHKVRDNWDDTPVLRLSRYDQRT